LQSGTQQQQEIVLHKLEGSEKEFAAQLSQLLLAAQQQKELILESIENLKSEVARKDNI